MGRNQDEHLYVALREEIPGHYRMVISAPGIRSNYWTAWIITAPTVKAIMTPTIITLDACWVRRITEVTAEIPSMAAIKAAGAITKGISLVNQMSVCIFFYLAVMNVMAGQSFNIYTKSDNSTRLSNRARQTGAGAISSITYLN